jgi:hypothetical protein
MGAGAFGLALVACNPGRAGTGSSPSSSASVPAPAVSDAVTLVASSATAHADDTADAITHGDNVMAAEDLLPVSQATSLTRELEMITALRDGVTRLPDTAAANKYADRVETWTRARAHACSIEAQGRSEVVVPLCVAIAGSRIAQIPALSATYVAFRGHPFLGLKSEVACNMAAQP